MVLEKCFAFGLESTGAYDFLFLAIVKFENVRIISAVCVERLPDMMDLN